MTILRRRRGDRAPDPLRTPEAQWPRELERRKRPRAPLHFRRIELKYLVPERLLNQVIENISPWTNVDPFLVRQGGGAMSYLVTSLYFDSWDLHSLYEKDGGMLYRSKLRLRTYSQEFAEDRPCFAEIKRRLDFVVLKDRISLPAGVIRRGQPIEQLLRTVLAAAKPDETTREAEVLSAWYSLMPTAFVRYRRFPFVAVDDRSARLTIDVDLEGKWRPQDVLDTGPVRRLSSHLAGGCDGISGRYAILELKCDHAVPAWFHRIVQDLELRRTAYSKYVLAVLSLRPGLLPTTAHEFASVGVSVT